MRRTAASILVFVAGLGIGFSARSAMGVIQRRTHAADLAAIEKLHQEDIAATLTQDPKGLEDIWAEDAVRFNPGGSPTVGKQAIRAENDKVRAQYPSFKVLRYAAKYQNIQIADGLACEWGEHHAEYKASAEGPQASFDGKGLDVLSRQSDGSWKFEVLILNQ
jgi:uncharacterized protein (TIGR02246 family)